MIRYGLIGSGMMGQEHIRNIQMLEGTEVTAIADPDQGMRELSQKNCGGNAKLYSDYRDMLKDDICDAYVVVSPNDTHYQVLLDAIPSDKPILCEKPLCTTTKDCREIIQLSESRKAPIWVAMEYRYMPPVQRLLAEIEKGTVGDLHMMSIREHRYPFLEKVNDWNRFNSRSGGTLVEKCCHFWDLMRLTLRSDPIRVYASAAIDVNHIDERYEGRTPDIIDNAFVTVDFANGSRGMLDLCMFAEGVYWQEQISVTGPKSRVDAYIPGPARFSADGKERHAQLGIADRKTQRETWEEIFVDEEILQAGDHHGSTFYQHQKFLDMVRSGSATPEVSLQDGLWSVLVGEAAELSAKTGKAIQLDQL